MRPIGAFRNRNTNSTNDAEVVAKADPLDLARASRDRGLEDNRRLMGVLRSVGTMFGDTIREALGRRVEPVVDNLYDACSHYEDVVSACRDEFDRLGMALSDESARRSEAVLLLRAAVDDFDRRRKRGGSRMAEPEWVARARLLHLGEDEEPF